MKKIKTIDELDEILNKRFDLKYFTTSMKSKSEYEKKLENLYLFEEVGNFLILHKRDGFYIADGFLKRDAEFKFNFDEDVVLEYTFKRFDEEGSTILKNLGFKEKLRRTQMELKVDGDFKDEFYLLDETYLSEVHKEIDRSFDRLYGCIPTEDELKHSFKNREVLGIIEENRLKGFIEFKEGSKKSIIINHISVLKDFRRCGIGKKLIENLCSYVGKIGYNRIELFVNDNNEEAFKFYKSLGFIEKNIKSIIYGRLIWKKKLLKYLWT